MKNFHKMMLRAGLAAMAVGMVATPAHSITYLGTRTVGGATAQLSITTDNTIGVLATANVTDWSIKMTFGPTSVDLFGPLSGNNSGLRVFGTAFSATATDLLFDFGGADFIIFDDYSFGRDDAYCLDGRASLVATSCTGDRGSETVFINRGIVFETARPTGVQVLASSGAVPEPASWALMIAGFGLVGAGMRRRVAKVSYAARASW